VQERLLLPAPEYLTRQWFDAACQQNHLRPNVVLESAVPHALIALAKVGYGVAIVPSHMPFDRRDLQAVPLAAGGKVLGAWAAIAWDPRRFRPPFVDQFVEELVKYSGRSYPGARLVKRRVLRSIPVG
jgi:DNA-binding transcriptional LysR family regulator